MTSQIWIYELVVAMWILLSRLKGPNPSARLHLHHIDGERSITTELSGRNRKEKRDANAHQLVLSFAHIDSILKAYNVSVQPQHRGDPFAPLTRARHLATTRTLNPLQALR